MSETPSLDVRVKSIHARQLFGMYDHDIVLKPERTTIVFGRNGVGKTVMFKLTHALLSGEVAAMLDLLRYPYREFKVLLSDGSEVIAVREEGAASALTQLRYVPAPGAGAVALNVTITEKVFTKFATRLERRLPLHQIGPDRWRDDETGEVLDAFEVVSRWGELGDDEVSREILEWKEFASSHLPQTLLIQAQRLIRIGRASARPYLRRESTAIRETVLEYSADLKSRIDHTLAEYGREAQRLDQTYPQRLLKQASAQSPEVLMEQEAIIESLHTMKKQQADYQALGILDEQTPSMALDESQLLTDVYLVAMSVYVRDTQAKLKIVDNLAQRVHLLLELISPKFSNKALKIDPKTHDLVVQSTHGKAQRLSVNALSSGEQHQLVLAYDLLFRTQPNTLVLLDEPELSLHVDWQERFLSDLKAVIDLVGFDALLATHSPYIINGHNELTVGLSVQVTANTAK